MSQPWYPPQKPAEVAESRLIDAILDGRFPIGSSLPAERELAEQIGVTRPTLREALQRLARDGWIEIRQGRPTRVRNYWQEGNLGVLGAIVRQSIHLPEDFVSNLLAVRLLLAPAYTRLALERQAPAVASLLSTYPQLPDEPEAFASADWDLHHTLTVASGNPIFTLILNGFCDFYQTMAVRYFSQSSSRNTSRAYYTQLLQAARIPDPVVAEELTRVVMENSIRLWESAQ